MAGMPADRHRPADLEITSPANPRIKQLVALRRRRAREQAGVTLVEGLAEIELALAAGVRPQALYYCPALASPDVAGARRPRSRSTAREVIEVSRPVFEKISYREGPDGWLAVVPAVESALDRLELSAAAAGPGLRGAGEARQPRRDPADRGRGRRRRGDRRRPGHRLGQSERGAREQGNRVLGAGRVGGRGSGARLDRRPRPAASWPRRRTRTSWSPTTDLTGPTAIAVGAEQTGLPADWLDRADVRVRIPMFGRADSLNVSTRRRSSPTRRYGNGCGGPI